ncbi:MAG: hypothetical protein MSK39_06135, partial [Dysosmobacter sp.]|nr:hypothetical protein [Dysosmobacter sp.]
MPVVNGLEIVKSGKIRRNTIFPDLTVISLLHYLFSYSFPCSDNRIVSLWTISYIMVARWTHKPPAPEVQNIAYACKKCEEETGEANILKTPKQPVLCPGSFASAEAVAHIMTQKFVMY